MKGKKILTIFGTRPEVIKLAPLVKKLEEDSCFQNFTCNTGQHKEIVNNFLDVFNIKPDYDLEVMEESQTLNEITTRILLNIEKVLDEVDPDLILVQGDTTTALTGTLASYYAKKKIGHVEAGLRSHCKYNPFPEEKNRELIDHLSDLFFCPTERSKENLLKENISEDIFVTGNTVIDSLNWLLENKKIPKEDLFGKIGLDTLPNKFLLFTSHRRESFGEDLRNIFKALKEIVGRNDDLEIIYPVHLNPKVRKPAFEILEDASRIHLIEPLNYVDFINLLNYSYLVITDSGGIIEEVPSLNKPVLIIRKETERPEAIDNGCAKLIGTEKENIINKTEDLIRNKELYEKMAEAENPFGGGNASQRIVKAIKDKI